uniref:Tyrosine-protein phosphatase YVH1 n=1 Tax=Ganoderma boninense TaxID=34458 RepID=A0A5K1K545_9APHY|nr:Tyrosine-protein phosphatase YVH1 [Ganoderma boninense]
MYPPLDFVAGSSSSRYKFREDSLGIDSDEVLDGLGDPLKAQISSSMHAPPMLGGAYSSDFNSETFMLQPSAAQHGFSTPTMVARSTYMRALATVEALKRRIHQLEKENVDVLAEARNWKSAFEKVLGSSGNTDVVSAETQTQTTYDRVKHKNLKFWSAESWKPYKQGGAKYDFYKSSDGVPIFLENLDGTVINKHAFSDLNTVIKLSYHSLKSSGLAAPSWGKMSKEGYEYMEKQVANNFPAIREAEGN